MTARPDANPKHWIIGMLLPVQPHRPHTARASLALLSIVSSLALSSIGCPKPCSPEEDTTNSVAPSEVTETTDLSGTTGVQTRSDMQAPSETFQFPDEVNINQMFISFPNMKFNIQDADACSKIGEIESVFWSAAIQFKMRDASGKQIARGRQKIISWGVEFEIFDEADQKIATVEERVWESIFKTTTAYDIKAPDGSLLGTSHKFDFFAKSFDIKDPDGVILAEIDKGFWESFARDIWHARLHDRTKIDPRILLMIPAFKSYADATRD